MRRGDGPVSGQTHNYLLAVLGIGWILTVSGSYYFFSQGYYVEKITTFSAFLFGAK